MVPWEEVIMKGLFMKIIIEEVVNKVVILIGILLAIGYYHGMIFIYTKVLKFITGSLVRNTIIQAVVISIYVVIILRYLLYEQGV